MALLKITFRIDIVAGTPLGLARDYVLLFLSETFVPFFTWGEKIAAALLYSTCWSRN